MEETSDEREVDGETTLELGDVCEKTAELPDELVRGTTKALGEDVLIGSDCEDDTNVEETNEDAAAEAAVVVARLESGDGVGPSDILLLSENIEVESEPPVLEPVAECTLLVDEASLVVVLLPAANCATPVGTEPVSPVSDADVPLILASLRTGQPVPTERPQWLTCTRKNKNKEKGTGRRRTSYVCT